MFFVKAGNAPPDPVRQMLEALCKTALTSCFGGEERVFLAAEAGPFSPAGAASSGQVLGGS